MNMWYKTGQFILKHRLVLLILLGITTLMMGWEASKVQLSYDFTRALPTDNPKYREYQAFLKKFGADGNTMVIGISATNFYTPAFFNEVGTLHQRLKKVPGVTDILSIPEVVNLVNDTLQHQFKPVKIFHYPYSNQLSLDSSRRTFESLAFYKNLLYNPDTCSYLMGVSVNKDTINSRSRTKLIGDIIKEVTVFEKHTQTTVFTSGLPLGIRSKMR